MYNFTDHFRDDRLGLDNRHDQASHRWAVIFSSMDPEAIGEELPRPDSASLVRIHPLFVREDMFIVYHQLHHHCFGICDCNTCKDWDFDADGWLRSSQTSCWQEGLEEPQFRRPLLPSWEVGKQFWIFSFLIYRWSESKMHFCIQTQVQECRASSVPLDLNSPLAGALCFKWKKCPKVQIFRSRTDPKVGDIRQREPCRSCEGDLFSNHLMFI